MSPEEAARLQYLYVMARREYVADPANGLIPYPTDTSKRLPDPGAVPLADDEDG